LKQINEDKSEEFKRHQEIILVLDKPEYIKTSEGQVVRNRGCEELRFTLSEQGLETFIQQLQAYKEANESDLT